MNLLLKPFNEMTAEDYAELDMKAGLEIHQQLYTEKKLFCHCPAGKYNKAHDAELLRRMRPTLSELGEYDGTALMEFKTKKEIIYQINHESVCTYEMDDTPPFEINQEALDISLEIAMLMNYQLVSEIHIARKQYLDGSIPTGFQRTTIVGIDGWIQYKNRKIGLIQLGLEEDSCREISDEGHFIYFKTDRLGMPLIEVVTDPDMIHPDEVAEVAEIIGRLLRATGKVLTGPGATRQDVNVSARGGTRIEIKGVPSLKWIPALTHYEAFRQVALLKVRDELAKRGITKDNLQYEVVDLTHVLHESKNEHFKKSLKEHGKIKGIVLKGLQGLMLHTTQPGKTFFHEIVGRLRVIACLDNMPNAYHTDHYPDYAKSANDIRKILQNLNVGKDDVAIVVWGSDMDTTTACKEIVLRIEDAIIGIPSETRQAFPSGINDFERILPGANRMYPDTDLPPHAITKERVEKLRQHLPVSPLKRSALYQGLGASFKVARALSISPFAGLIEQLLNIGITIKILQTGFYEFPIALSREGLQFRNIPEESLRKTFDMLKAGDFKREYLWNIIHTLAKKPAWTPENVLERNKILPMLSESDVVSIINDELAIKPTKEHNLSKISAKKHFAMMLKHYMGRIMHKRNVKGRFAGKKVADMLRAKITHIVEQTSK
ncbi:MAG: Glu-tRNA(Gln) amidotransferase subunit GatE [Candidatus Heimdallarchaeota archaeon]|nr:Glu-tRNA(Gln) amidotransferase subunit GatE [Candidatus Heimdallarchaeota archaeon]